MKRRSILQLVLLGLGLAIALLILSFLRVFVWPPAIEGEVRAVSDLPCVADAFVGFEVQDGIIYHYERGYRNTHCIFSGRTSESALRAFCEPHSVWWVRTASKDEDSIIGRLRVVPERFPVATAEGRDLVAYAGVLPDIPGIAEVLIHYRQNDGRFSVRLTCKGHERWFQYKQRTDD